MLRKRRTWPASSRRWGFRSGKFSSSTEKRPSRLVAAQVREAVPAVWRRRAVGIWTVMDMLRLLKLGLCARFLSVVAPKSKAGRAIARLTLRLCSGQARKSARPTQTLRAYCGGYFFCDFGHVQGLLEVFFELG